jgi:toxin CptA
MQTYLFNVKSSFLQKLALSLFTSLCLFSFSLWPTLNSLIYQIIKLSLVLSVAGFFIYQFWQLSRWKYQFTLDDAGQGILSVTESVPSASDINQQHFTQQRSAIVTPLFCLLFLEMTADNRQIKMILPVWRDMLDDTSYRHLCRLLSRPISNH